MFADEAHYSRRFTCGWSTRAETALDIARKVRATTRALGELDPRLELLWPQFARRAIRPTDPGPVLELSDEELGALIDRRARFDPPKFPAPVDSSGYLVALGGSPAQSQLKLYGGMVWAGAWGARAENWVQIGIDHDHPVWRDLALAARVLVILLEIWGAEWGFAAALPSNRPPGLNTVGRVLLTWRGAKEMPARYTFDNTGPPAEVRSELGGELRVWP